MDLKGKTIGFFGGGERYFSNTLLASIGKAVAGVLQHQEETKNRDVYVRNTAITLKKLSAMGKEALGGESGGWKEHSVSTDKLYQPAMAQSKKDKPNSDIFVINFIMRSIWGERHGCHFITTDNEIARYRGNERLRGAGACV